MFTTTVAPASASWLIGMPGCQMSSQIVRPTVTPSTSMSAPPGPLGEAHDGDDPRRLGGDAVHGLARVGEKVLLEQEVLRRVAGDGELGEQDELGACGPGTAQVVEHAPLVAGDVPDHGVHLGQRDAQRAGHVAGGGYPAAAPRCPSMNARRFGSAGSVTRTPWSPAIATIPSAAAARRTSTACPACSRSLLGGPAMSSASACSAAFCAVSE